MLMGVTVRQKVKGRGQPWWVFVAHNGKRTSRCVGKKGAAEEAAGRIQAQLALGQFDLDPPAKEQPPALFKQYADAWIDTIDCKPSTRADYRAILKNHVGPVFYSLPMTEVTRGHIKRFLLGKKADGFAKSTVTHMKNVVSGIMSAAVDDEIIPANPALNLGKNFIKSDASGNNADPLTTDELAWLLQVVEALYPGHFALFLTLARTGMRVGEALALKWDAIDFRSRFIIVRTGMSRGREETPKSGKSRRVDMSRQLTATLKTLKHERKEQTVRCGWGAVPDWVFVDAKGGPIDLNNWRRRVFKKALEKAELRGVRIHDIRHSYASIRIAKGDNIQDVSKQLGHHSVKLTLDVYSHWLPGKKKAEVDALDDMDSSAPYTHPETSDQQKRATGNSVTL
jgi:integrase